MGLRLEQGVSLMSIRRAWLVVLLPVALAACGGGSSTPGTSLSLDRSTLRFEATLGAAAPGAQTIAASWVGDGLIVGYPVGISPPSWLRVTVAQTGPTSAVATVSISSGGLPPGTHTTTLRFVTGREDGSDVKHVDVEVTFALADGFAATMADYDFTRTWGTATELQGAPILISTSARAWHVQAGAPWVKLGKTQGAGAATVSVSVDAATQEPVGTSTATVTVSATPPDRTSASGTTRRPSRSGSSSPGRARRSTPRSTRRSPRGPSTWTTTARRS